jgi:hypothetical protein
MGEENVISVTKLAFSGPKYSGKDTVTDTLEMEYCFTVASFSDQLKKIVKSIFGFMQFDYESSEKETRIVYTNPETKVQYTPRMVWQAFDMLPEIYPGVFVDSVQEEFIRLRETMQELGAVRLGFCIKDVRRPAELEYVKNNGFTLVFIDTDDPRSTNEASRHKSESFYPIIRSHADVYFFNSKMRTDWQLKIKNFIENLASTYKFEDLKKPPVIEYAGSVTENNDWADVANRHERNQ